jgi:hypothetical protein
MSRKIKAPKINTKKAHVRVSESPIKKKGGRPNGAKNQPKKKVHALLKVLKKEITKDTMQSMVQSVIQKVIEKGDFKGFEILMKFAVGEPMKVNLNEIDLLDMEMKRIRNQKEKINLELEKQEMDNMQKMAKEKESLDPDILDLIKEYEDGSLLFDIHNNDAT